MKLMKSTIRISFLFSLVIMVTIPMMGQETWFEIKPDVLPPERAAFGMIYDGISQRPILFGGFNSAGKALNDTWAFQGNEWVPVKSSTEPPARYFPTFNYNPNNDTGILVAGISETGFLSDAWEYSNGNWRLLAANAIPGRHSHAAAFDSQNSALYILGGIGTNSEHFSDFWIFEPEQGDGIWNEVDIVEGPGPLYGHALVYDAYRQQIVLFGGADASSERNNDTWIYKYGLWTQLVTEHVPSPRIYHKMIYDSEKKQVVLFGGFEDGNRLNDLWVFNGEDWIPQATQNAPPERSSHEMIYNHPAKRIDCFGGIGSANDYFNDLWVFYELSVSFDKDLYTSIHDRAVITVSDLSANLNPNEIDTVSVIVESDGEKVGISLTLYETDINTGIFMNASEEEQLKFSLIESNQDLNQIKISDGDRMYANYTSPSGVGEIFAMAVWQGIGSVLQWDKPIYIGYKDEAILTMDNPNANLDLEAIETITVKVASDAYPTGINVVLTEISPESGIFTFAKGAKGLTFHPKYVNQGKVEILVQDGDTLQLTYQNPYDGSIYSNSVLWVRFPINMEFDKDLYIGPEKANLVLYDSDLNFNPELSETVWLQLVSDTDPVGMGIPAYETGPNTGIFDPGQIGFDTSGTSFGNRLIHVSDGDVVSAIHSQYLKEPIYANTRWLLEYPPIQDRPAVFIIFGPEEDEVTSESIVTFHFTATGETLKKINPRNMEFKTKLLGYETEWTPWIQGTTRVYDNLPGGEYVFIIQCRSPKPEGEGEGYWVSLPVFRRFYVNREGQPPLVSPKLVVTPGDNFVYLEWTHPYRENLLGYHIYRREEGQDTISLNTLPLDPSLSDYTDGPIIPHKRYEYFVRAVDVEGNIKDSNKVWCAANEDIRGADILVFSEDFLDMGTSLNETESEIYNQTMTEPIYWTLYSDTPSLSFEPASGIAYGGAIKVKIKLDRKGFSVGFHELRLHIRSNASSYLPVGINEENAVKIRFMIPGEVVHDSHKIWSEVSLSRTLYEYVFVDFTPQFANYYRVVVAAELSSNSRVDLSPWGLGSWPMASTTDINPLYLLNGDRNGQIDAGETVNLEVGLMNTGTIEIRSSTLVFYSSDEFVEVVSPNFTTVNNICACATGFKTSFKFTVSQNIPLMEEGYPFRIYGLLVDTDGYKWLMHIDLKAFNFPLRHTYTIDDDILGFSFGNNNKIIETSENIEIPLTIHNIGVSELPQIVYYLDQVTSPSEPIFFSRSSFKSRFQVPPLTSQNVEGDFEFTVAETYEGGQIDFRLSSAFINPYIYDEYCIPLNYLCVAGSVLPHPDGKVNDEGEPIFCPVFQFAYSYVKEKKFGENIQGINEGESTFTDDTQGWLPHLENPPFSAPVAGWDPGGIYLQTANNTDCHGFWESSPDYSPIIKNNLYRARFTIHSDQEDSSLSPAFRLRAFDDLGGQADILVISSEGSGICAPGTKPREYNLYFVPNQETGNSLRFAWDIINFNLNDAPEGTLFLDDLIIERIDLDLLPMPFRIRHYNFFDSVEGWEYSTIPNFFTPAIGYQTNGVLQIIGVDSNTFGCWANPRLDIIQGENLRLFCTEITARTDFETPRDQVPQLRFRINALNHQYAVLKNINSEGTGENSLDIINKTYKVFCYSPTDEDGNPVQDVPLQIYIDYINFNAADYANSTVKIDEVSVDVYPPDPMP